MWPRLVRVVSPWCNGRWEAEDAAQEALSRAVAKADRDGEAPSDPWVTAVAINVARSRLRRLLVERRPRPIRLDRDEEQPEVLSHELHGALRRLPRRQREAVVLRYLADLSVDGTAEVMGCSPGTVKAHVRDALARLREDPVFGVDALPAPDVDRVGDPASGPEGWS
ncbi:MAG: sigma-70 family RNA polymerase sigma factor [Microthrixaceae bacterium]